MNTYKLISIIIPVYNEEKYIAQTLEKVVSTDIFHLKKEIIMVDDASTDHTRDEVATFIQKTNEHITVIKKEKNDGKGAAVKIGINRSKGDIVLIQDADLEYTPHDYPALVEPFLKYGADVVYGSRFYGSKPHRVLYFWHYVANIILTIFSNMLTNLNISDMETGYKAFKGEIIRSIGKKLMSKQFGFEPEITARIAKIKNIRIYEVGISYQGRTYAEGKKIGWIDGVRALWEIVKYNIFTN